MNVKLVGTNIHILERPCPLTSMLRSFDRSREKGKKYSILTDRQFAKTREALYGGR